MTDLDVPQLIDALAERFEDHGLSTREALAIAMDMLAEAMDDPDAFDLQLIPYLH